MMINSYISKGFFDEFIQSKPQSILSDDYKHWLSLYRFFDRHVTNLRLGEGKRSLGEKVKTDELIYNLMNDYFGGKSNIEFENWDDDETKLKTAFNEQTFQYFFTSSQENIDELILKSGFPVYNSANGLELSSKLSNLEALPISQNSETNTLANWDELTKKLLPFNTLTIVDNYLFSSEWAIRNNTIPLIKSIAESIEIDICFHLSLVFFDLKKDNENKEIRNINAIYKQVRGELMNIFKDSNKFKLSIIRLNKRNDFHDRAIFTNSQFMTSGNSFSSYFKDFSGVNLLSPTILTIFPFIGEYQKGIWGEIAFEILNYLYELSKKVNSQNKVGEPIENNRLFKQFLNSNT